MEYVSELKYLGCALDESGIDEIFRRGERMGITCPVELHIILYYVVNWKRI